MTKQMTIAEYHARVGTSFGASDWYLIDQARIDEFAKNTEDFQFIHIDTERAKDTPFGTTIAHGFLTLSMLSAMFYDVVPDIIGSKMGVNYGFDKIRFLAPVKAGARIRGHFTLQELRESRPGEVTNVWEVKVEIENEDKPALIAKWIGRDYVGE
ncbi:MAG: MaoC family dehydratase [Paracoccaceae bacterium]